METITDDRLRELTEKAQRGEAVQSGDIQHLLAAFSDIKRNHELALQLESGYIDEIQRLNYLMKELIEYVETIAEIIQDTFETADVSDEVKRKAVQIIIESVQRIREQERIQIKVSKIAPE